MSELTPEDFRTRRLKDCVERFGIDGEYDPHCCRFPKSCSPYAYFEAYQAGNLTEDDLEPPPVVHEIKPKEPKKIPLVVYKNGERLVLGEVITEYDEDDGTVHIDAEMIQPYFQELFGNAIPSGSISIDKGDE